MSLRRPLIAGNWKMNGLISEGRDLAQEIVSWYGKNGTSKADVLVCPPFTLIAEVAKQTAGSPIEVGGQTCHFEEAGAHTGDISASMLKDVGCSSVIVGHSERRADHFETNQIVEQKAQAAHEVGLVSIICVGETWDQRSAGQTFDVIRSQILGSVPRASTATNTVIAYEPIWAIGTGKVATPDQVQDVHALIRSTLNSLLGEWAGQALRILYGGSMKPDNAASLLALPDVDGGLIGGAALKAPDFTAIIALAESV